MAFSESRVGKTPACRCARTTWQALHGDDWLFSTFCYGAQRCAALHGSLAAALRQWGGVSPRDAMAALQSHTQAEPTAGVVKQDVCMHAGERGEGRGKEEEGSME